VKSYINVGLKNDKALSYEESQLLCQF